MKKLSLALLAIIMCITLFGCAAKPAVSQNTGLNNPFIGKWEANIPSAGMELTFEFNTDGTFDVSDGEKSMGTGSYLVRNDKMVTLDDAGELEQYTFKEKDKQAIDVTEDGTTTTFNRVD